MESGLPMDMEARPDLAALLPAGALERLERDAGAMIVGIRPRGGGGASRDGAEIELRYPDGTVRRGYFGYSARAEGARRRPGFEREASVLRALSGPLKSAGVRAPEYLAADEGCLGILTAFAPGEPDFKKLTDPSDRSAVAADFMAQLAALHSIDIGQIELRGFGPQVTAEAAIRARIAEHRAASQAAGGDPLILLALDWLERNIPPEPERMVLLHGDAGPANFLYEDGKVTALLDWELTHFGDPMADLAMICIRNLFQPFVPLPEAFAAYEAAGGANVDLDRVRYYRAFFQVGFTGGAIAAGNPDAPPPPALGMNLVYSTAHMRILNEALAEAAGLDLQDLELPDAAPGAHHRSFEIALADLRDVIVPRAADQQAATKAKGLARLVKWWRDSERWGPAFERDEIAELSAAFGRPVASVAEGRQLFSSAILGGGIDLATAIRLCHARVTRDTKLAADAMGAFATTHYKPLI